MAQDRDAAKRHPKQDYNPLLAGLASTDSGSLALINAEARECEERCRRQGHPASRLLEGRCLCGSSDYND